MSDDTVEILLRGWVWGSIAAVLLVVGVDVLRLLLRQ